MVKKRRHKSHLPKMIFFLLFVTATIIAALTVKTFIEDTTPEQNNNSQETKKDESTRKTQSLEQETEVIDSDIVKEDGVQIIEESNPNLSASVTGSVSKALFSNNKYRLAITTDQALSEGNCDLVFSSSNQELTASAEIVAHPNSSSCTFDLDPSNISSGFWHVKVTVYTTQNRYGIIEDTVEVVK